MSSWWARSFLSGNCSMSPMFRNNIERVHIQIVIGWQHHESTYIDQNTDDCVLLQMLAMWCIHTTCSGLGGPYAPYNKPFISRQICIRYSDVPENQHFTHQYRSQLLTQTIPIGYIFSLWFHLILHKNLATQKTFMVFKLDVLVQMYSK